MSKEDMIKLKGKVIQVLPNAFFRVRILDEHLKDNEILCHISGKMRQNKINILMNDTVDIEVSMYDMSKGRVVFRYKN